MSMVVKCSYQKHWSCTVSECDIPVPGIPGTGNFSSFLVVSVPVSEIIDTRKKSQNRYRKNLVPEKSTGIGIENIWYRKKLSVKIWYQN